MTNPDSQVKANFIRSDLAQLVAYTPHTDEEITKQPAPIDQLDTNESPFDLPPAFKEKLAWHYQHQLRTNRYPDGSHQALKKAIAHYVNESATLGNTISPENISVGNGSDELIRSLLIATCLGEGSILVAQPTFSMYAILAQTLGIQVVTVGRSPTDFAINLTEAQAAIAQTHPPAIRVVFVVHPNSPTANPLTQKEIDWLRSLPANILVAIDEAYFEFNRTSLVSELPQHPNWAILRTFSKAFRLAAHRVGYCIAHPELVNALEKIRLPYNLPSFSQAAALLALNERQQLLSAIDQILAERDRLMNALAQHPAVRVWPSSANFIYMRLKNASPETLTPQHDRLVLALKNQGTLVRHTGGGIRITVGTPAENTRTLERLIALL